MKAMIRTVEDHGVEYQAIALICPGCALMGGEGLHMLPIDWTGHPVWEWNGDLERVTLTPSIATEGGPPDARWLCHSFLTGGEWRFLDDCTHALRGQTVAMADLPEWFTE
jgi:Family of unknown function (DUF6527)